MNRNCYYPSGWQLTRVPDNLIKLFHCFAGGYVNGDSWRLNSGITKIVDKNNLYSVYSYSGSMCVINKADEGFLTGYTQSVLNQFLERVETVELISMEEVILNCQKFNIEYVKE